MIPVVLKQTIDVSLEDALQRLKNKNAYLVLTKDEDIFDNTKLLILYDNTSYKLSDLFGTIKINEIYNISEFSLIDLIELKNYKIYAFDSKNECLEFLKEPISKENNLED